MNKEVLSSPVPRRMRIGNIHGVEYTTTTYINSLKQIFLKALHDIFCHICYTYITMNIFKN